MPKKGEQIKCRRGHVVGRTRTSDGHCKECVRARSRKLVRCKRGHLGERWPNGTCKQCQAEHSRLYKQRSRVVNVTIRARAIWDNAKGNAKKRGIEFSVQVERVEQLLRAALARGDVRMATNHPGAPSIDRIDSSVGYLDGNVQIVPCWYNRACSDWDKTVVEREIRAWLRQKDESRKGLNE